MLLNIEVIHQGKHGCFPPETPLPISGWVGGKKNKVLLEGTSHQSVAVSLVAVDLSQDSRFGCCRLQSILPPLSGGRINCCDSFGEMSSQYHQRYPSCMESMWVQTSWASGPF